MGKEQTKHRFALANRLFRADAFDGQSYVSSSGIQKLKIALIVSTFILVMLNDEDADGGVGSFERNSQPGRRSRADQFHFALRCETIEF